MGGREAAAGRSGPTASPTWSEKQICQGKIGQGREAAVGRSGPTASPTWSKKQICQGKIGRGYADVKNQNRTRSPSRPALSARKPSALLKAPRLRLSSPSLLFGLLVFSSLSCISA